jgi:hypothetical protein
MDPFTVVALLILAWFFLGGDASASTGGARPEPRNAGPGPAQVQNATQATDPDPSTSPGTYNPPDNVTNETAQPIGSDVPEAPPIRPFGHVNGRPLTPPPRSVGRAQLRPLTTAKDNAGGGGGVTKGFS